MSLERARAIVWGSIKVAEQQEDPLEEYARQLALLRQGEEAWWREFFSHFRAPQMMVDGDLYGE